MVDRYRDALAQLRQIGGAEACGDFILNGSVNLSSEELNGSYSVQMEGYLAALMHAAVSARDMPQRRKPVSDADWNAVFDAMENQAENTRDLNALADMDPSDPVFCDATIRMLDAMAISGSPAISRARADYIEALVQAS